MIPFAAEPILRGVDSGLDEAHGCGGSRSWAA